MSCPIRERDGREARARAAGDALKSYWQAIGQDIGLIPTRRGGKSDLIPEDWLSELANQARDLVAEVRRYQPDTANRVAVRTLLLAPPYPAGSRGNRIIAEHRLKDGRSPDDAYSSWDKQVGLNDWCLCLAFPMLTRKEIKDAKKNRAWLWLPAKRLGMSENTLSKRKTS